jgi:transcriptional regulator of met regulon
MSIAFFTAFTGCRQQDIRAEHLKKDRKKNRVSLYIPARHLKILKNRVQVGIPDQMTGCTLL